MATGVAAGVAAPVAACGTSGVAAGAVAEAGAVAARDAGTCATVETERVGDGASAVTTGCGCLRRPPLSAMTRIVTAASAATIMAENVNRIAPPLRALCYLSYCSHTSRPSL